MNEGLGELRVSKTLFYFIGFGCQKGVFQIAGGKCTNDILFVQDSEAKNF